MPHYPTEFEIPDAWLSEAGLAAFAPRNEAYRSATDARLVPLVEIEPIARVAKNVWRGFDRAQFIRLLTGVIAGDQIEPVPAVKLPVHELAGSPCRYQLRDGCHRFHASIVAGFDMLPIALRAQAGIEPRNNKPRRGSWRGLLQRAVLEGGLARR